MSIQLSNFPFFFFFKYTNTYAGKMYIILYDSIKNIQIQKSSEMVFILGKTSRTKTIFEFFFYFEPF